MVDDTGFVKDGRASPGVARQHSGALGKVGNCQIGVSVHAVTDTASCPLNWRLFLPPSWDHGEHEDEQAAREVLLRSRRCGIPEAEGHRSKWRMAVEMLDELDRWGLRPPVVVADAGYGDKAHLRAALAERGLDYVVQVKGQVTAHPADACPQLIVHQRSGPGRWSLPRYRTKPVSLREHVLAAGRTEARTLTWRHGSKGMLTSQFVILPVRVAGRRPRLGMDRTLPLAHVIAQWPHGEDEPVKYWLSNLPADTPPADLVRLAKIRWRIEHDYRELKTALDLTKHY